MFASLVEKFQELDTGDSAPTSRQTFKELLQKAGYDGKDEGAGDSQDASWFAFIRMVLQEKEESGSAETAAGAASTDSRGVDQAAAPAATSTAPVVDDHDNPAEGLVSPVADKDGTQNSRCVPLKDPAAQDDAEKAADSNGKEAQAVEECVAAEAEAVAAPTVAGAAEAGCVLQEAPEVEGADGDELFMYEMMNPFDLEDTEVSGRNPSVLDTQGATMPGFRTSGRWSNNPGTSSQRTIPSMVSADSEFWQDISAPNSKNRTSHLMVEMSSQRTRMKSEVSIGSWTENENENDYEN